MIMAKKKIVKLTKMSKWTKIILWIVGVLVGLVVVVILGLKVWVSTWPEYKGKEFSFRYPPGWYTSDYLTTYISGSNSLGGLQLSPQPRFLENARKIKIVDHSQVPVTIELDFYDQSDNAAVSWVKNQKIISFNIGNGKFVHIRLTEIGYIVLAKNKIYVFGSIFNSLTKSSILSKPYIALETLLTMLSLKYY